MCKKSTCFGKVVSPTSQYNSSINYDVGHTAENKKINIDFKRQVVCDENEWVSHLSQEEKEAIHDYTKELPPYYRNINRVLRGQECRYEDGNENRSELIHSALSKAKTSMDMTLWRGISDELFHDLCESASVGDVFVDRGYVSCSMSEGSAFHKDVLLVINLPAGSCAASISSLSAAGKYEEEVLIDKEQLFCITSIDNDKYGRKVITVDVLN